MRRLRSSGYLGNLREYIQYEHIGIIMLLIKTLTLILINAYCLCNIAIIDINGFIAVNTTFSIRDYIVRKWIYILVLEIPCTLYFTESTPFFNNIH